jgi:hypothetical protein
MRFRDVSYALKAVAEVARAGERLVGSLDRSRPRGYLGSILVGVGLGVGLGALLFSESARQRLRGWLTQAPLAVQAGVDEVVDASIPPPGGSRVESASPPH